MLENKKFYGFKISENWSWIIILSVIIPMTVYVLLKGENTYIPIHDNLDGNVSMLKVLKDSGLLFAHNKAVPIMNGIDRNYLPSELKIHSLLYMIFPTFTAYIVSQYMKVIISVTSFILLGKEFFRGEYNQYKNIVVFCGFLYGLLPTYPTSCIAFASVPLFIYLVFMLYCYPERKRYLVLIFLFPILTDFVMFGIFLGGYLLALIIITGFINRNRSIKYRGGGRNLLAALILFSLGCVFTDYRLFKIMLFSPELTIRSSMSLSYTSFSSSLKESFNVFWNSMYHSGSLQGYFMFPVCFGFYIYKNYVYIKEKQLKKLFADSFNILIYIQLFNSLLYGFFSFKPLNQMVRTIIPPLSGFDFGRAQWLNPCLLVISFGLVLIYIYQRHYTKLLRIMAACSIIIVLIVPEMYNQISLNIRENVKTALNNMGDSPFIHRKFQNALTYKEFFSTDLFEEIKLDIDYKGEKAVAFGFHPSVLSYNDIFTIDGYLSYSSLEYKQQFRKLIAPALELDEGSKEYFDNWGGRAYVYPVNGTYIPFRNMPYKETEFYFDPQIFREMNGRYVFSRGGISNAKEMELELTGIYQNENSPYVIYVYSVLES